MQRRVFSKELKIEAVKLSKREIRGDCEVPRDLAAAMAMRDPGRDSRRILRVARTTRKRTSASRYAADGGDPHEFCGKRSDVRCTARPR
jgi:hypothetical protein